jgi:hypothetical protein
MSGNTAHGQGSSASQVGIRIGNTDHKTETPDVPNYHYISLPLLQENTDSPQKHITVCVLDKLNKTQTIVPIRAMIRARTLNLLPSLPTEAKLHTQTTSGFVAPPRTVVKVELPSSVFNTCLAFHQVLAANRSGVPSKYNPHITFESEEEAKLFLRSNPSVPLTRMSLVNAKTKKEVFAVPFSSDSHQFDEEYRNHLQRVSDWMF